MAFHWLDKTIQFSSNKKRMSAVIPYVDGVLETIDWRHINENWKKSKFARTWWLQTEQPIQFVS